MALHLWSNENSESKSICIRAHCGVVKTEKNVDEQCSKSEDYQRPIPTSYMLHVDNGLIWKRAQQIAKEEGRIREPIVETETKTEPETITEQAAQVEKV